MSLWSAILLMAAVTYLMRLLPMLLFTKQFEDPFVKAFFTYIPYAVLGGMVIPGIFLATNSIYSALIGFIVAVILAWRTANMPIVVFGAAFSVWLAELVLL